MAKPELRAAAIPPPRPPSSAPIVLPDAEALRSIVLRTCRDAPPAELLASPAGVWGVLEQWAPLARRMLLTEFKALPQHNPAAAILQRCRDDLRRLLDSAPQAAWDESLNERIATIEGWLREWPTTSPPRLPPAWHQAARGLRSALLQAFDESRLAPPSERQLAGAVRELLVILRVRVSIERVRNVMG
jgi:hypothetical protein